MNEANMLLRRALEALREIDNWECLETPEKLVMKDIRTYLDNQETTAKDEPTAYINLDEQRLEFAVPFEFNRSAFKQGKIPLYTNTLALNELISEKKDDRPT